MRNNVLARLHYTHRHGRRHAGTVHLSQDIVGTITDGIQVQHLLRKGLAVADAGHSDAQWSSRLAPWFNKCGWFVLMQDEMAPNPPQRLLLARYNQEIFRPLPQHGAHRNNGII